MIAYLALEAGSGCSNTGQLRSIGTTLPSNTIMKPILKVAILTFLFFATSSHCFALRGIYAVSKERAEKDFGATIRSDMLASNLVGVWLEFAPKGKLQKFHHVELEISSGGRKIVGADLRPLKQSEESVVVYFSTEPGYLISSTLTVIVSVDQEYAEGYQFNVKDFVKHEPSH